MTDTARRYAFDPEDLVCLTERIRGKYVRRWWISQDGLIRNLKGLTEGYLRTKKRPMYLDTVSKAKRGKEVLPDTGAAWRFAKLNGRYYYCLDNIPDQAPARYRSRLPQSVEMGEIKRAAELGSRLEGLKSQLKERLEAHQGDHMRHYYGYSGQHMADLSRACAALEAVVDLGHDGHSPSFLRDMGAALEAIGVRYLPRNYRRLQEKVAEVLAGKKAHELIDLPRGDNQNARKLNDPEIESWVVQMRGMPQNFSGSHIIRKVRLLCELTGKRQPSESWLASLIATPAVKFMTSAGRYGERGKLGQVYRDYTPVANALFADDCWQLDGTRVNFVPWAGAGGREEFLYMVVCRDVHSGRVLSCSFGLAEDRWMYVDCLAMAVKTTGSLPYEIAVDRFPGHNTPEWSTIKGRLEALGTKVSYKHAATGKAQLERWFSTLQSVFFNESAYYYGEGVQSRRAAAHRSAEYLKAVKKVARADGWDMDAATAEALRCIGMYNRTPLSSYSRKHAAVGHSPEQLYGMSEKPHSKAVAFHERALLFGLMKPVSIRNSVVKTEIQRAEYHYAVREYEVVKNHRRVQLAYDPGDLSRAWLFADDDSRHLNPRFLCEVDLVPRVQVFGPGADYESLGRDRRRQSAIVARRAADLEAVKSAGNGGEIAMLLNGLGKKGEAEAAETEFLLGQMGGGAALLKATNTDEADDGWDDGELDEAALVLGMM